MFKKVEVTDKTGENKETKNLYIENYETLMKEMEDTNKWRDSPCS